MDAKKTKDDTPLPRKVAEGLKPPASGARPRRAMTLQELTLLDNRIRRDAEELEPEERERALKNWETLKRRQRNRRRNERKKGRKR